MPAVKSGNHIYITGTGNTPASVAADINDTDFCDYDAVTQTLNVNNLLINRYFRVRSTGVFTLNDGDRLLFTTNTNNRGRFYVDANGTFIMNDGSILDGLGGTGYPYYWYWYGRIVIMGNGTDNPLLQNFRRIYRYNTTNSNYPNDTLRIENVTVGSCSVNNNYFIYCSAIARSLSMVFKNIIFNDRLASSDGDDTYFIHFAQGASKGALGNILIENCTGVEGERFINNTGGYPIHSKNNTWGVSHTSYPVLHYGSCDGEARYRYREYDSTDGKLLGQLFSYHEGDEWLDVGNASKVLVSYGATVLFKDCTWNDANGNSIVVQYQGRAMLWTGNTFVDTAPFSLARNGEISHVFGVDVEVTDQYENPIEDATVTFEQAQGFERFDFITEADGRLHTAYDTRYAFLTWKHQFGNSPTTTGNTDIWNDGIGDKYHTVTVSKDGYYTKKVIVPTLDSDKSMIVELEPVDRYGYVKTDQEGKL